VVLKQNVHVHWFELARKIKNLFDTVDIVNAVGVCALGSNNAWTTLVCMSVDMTDILFEQTDGLKYSGSFAGRCRCALQIVTSASTRIRSTNLLSYTDTLAYTSKNMLTEIISRETKTLNLVAYRIFCLL
jgi:hypothetical protein